MSMVLAVLTDGRDDRLERTIGSAESCLAGEFTTRLMYDDTGIAFHTEWLREKYSGYTVIGGSERLGFGGATAALWQYVKHETTEPYCVWHEDDFAWNRVILLDQVANVLDAQPWLAQMAFRRQPVNSAEIAAGGVIEQDPDSYEVRVNGCCPWLLHRNFWTTNPSLIPRRTFNAFDWPVVNRSEGMFSATLRDAGWSFGYWGARTDPPAVHHIGDVRNGVGY